MTDGKQFATFHLDDLFLGIEVVEVQEVIRFQPMTRVPLAPAMVRGLINLRGQIVTAIDLRRRFDMPPLAGGRLPVNVIVRNEDGIVSLLVDEIGDVMELPDEDFERPPETLKSVARDLISGVYKTRGRLLLILDTARAVSLPANFHGKPSPLKP